MLKLVWDYPQMLKEGKLPRQIFMAKGAFETCGCNHCGQNFQRADGIACKTLNGMEGVICPHCKGGLKDEFNCYKE